MLERFLRRLFRWCKDHDRYRLILDRDGVSPYLKRYYLFLKDRQKFPFNIVLHRILRSDLDDLHDHPWWYFTIILRGGYWETTVNGRFWRAPGYFAFRRATSLHKLEIPEGEECWTLFIMGPQKRDWGFMRNGVEWVEAEQYLRERGLPNESESADVL